MELYVDFARALREQYNEDECIFKRLKLEVAKDIDWLPHYVMCVQVNKTYYFAQATDTFKSARGIAAGLALCGENEHKFTEICVKHGVDAHDVLKTLHKYELSRHELPGKLDPSHTDNAEVWEQVTSNDDDRFEVPATFSAMEYFGLISLRAAHGIPSE